jgi:hypothetical protein
MMAKHIPGPWKVFHKRETLSVFRKEVDDVVHWSGFDSAGKTGRVTLRDVANAHLIAAAPEMLNALRSARHCIAETFGPDCMET